MDSLENLLAAELTRFDGTPVRSAEHVLAAVAGRRRRRSLGLSALVAAVAVGFVGTSLVGLPGTPGPHPTPTATSTAGIPFYPSAIAYGGGLADRDHGFVAFVSCAAADDCHNRLAVTDDGGRTWTNRALPELTATTTYGGLSVLDRDHLVMTTNPANAGTTHPAYASADGGRSWRPLVVSPAVDRIPAGGSAAVVLVEPARLLREVLVWSPDGRISPLTIPTGAASVIEDLQVTPSGTVVALTSTGAPGPEHLTVTVSADGGASWASHAGPRLASGARARLYTLDGRRLFVLETLPDEPAHHRLFSSTDGGRSWTEADVTDLEQLTTVTSIGTVFMVDLPLSPALAADGSLVVDNSAVLHRLVAGRVRSETLGESSHGAGTFSGGLLVRSSPGVVDAAGRARLDFSVDGRTWAPVGIAGD